MQQFHLITENYGRYYIEHSTESAKTSISFMETSRRTGYFI